VRLGQTPKNHPKAINKHQTGYNCEIQWKIGKSENSFKSHGFGPFPLSGIEPSLRKSGYNGLQLNPKMRDLAESGAFMGERSRARGRAENILLGNLSLSRETEGDTVC
jgi:hypothetical protein